MPPPAPSTRPHKRPAAAASPHAAKRPRELSESRPTAAQKALNARLCRADAGEIERLVEEQHGAMNSVNCATALHGLAKGAPAGARPPPSTACALLAARTAAVLSQEGFVTARSLTSIVWGMGKLRLTHPALLEAAVKHARAHLARGALDAFGVANVAWALANLHQHATSAADETVCLAAPHAELLDALAERACAAPDAFNPQELCNLLWAFATLKVRHAALFERCAAVVVARAADFTPQGLSQTIWAYSKLNLCKHSLLIAAANAALPRLATYDAQSLATLAWAFANLDVEHRALLSAICAQSSARLAEFGAASSSQLLWALSRLSDGVQPDAIRGLAAQLQRVAADGLKPQQLLYALGALAKLPHDVEAGLPPMLCAAAAAAAPQLTANKLGIACWALSRPSVLAGVPEATRREWCAALRRRVAEVLDHLGWRGAGYVEVALRQLGGLSESDPLAVALTRAVGAAVEASNARAAERNRRPAALLLARAPWEGCGLRRGSRVVLVGFDEAAPLRAALEAEGLAPVEWRRFAGGGEASGWPCLAAHGGAAACLVRWPWYAAGDAAVMLLRAAASAVAEGAPLWLCGNLDEGADGAAAVVEGAYGECRVIERREGAVLCGAVRGARGPAEQLTLDGWSSRTTLELPPPAGGARPWLTFPGLFAGGGLDVMTSALLDALPPPPERARVLDACCGSGAIAAALLARARERGRRVRLHLTDADACAIAAARANVPDAKRFFLCDVWPETQSAFPKTRRPARYEWIVSNPPVHRGQPDDFTVLLALIRGAPQRLKKHGVLWMVAQQQVPIGRMLAQAGWCRWVEAIISKDGRFVVWSAGAGKKRKYE
ncbi:hypothetical protein AB1Y20_019939 [Prymnesium parvum]|uniref:Methyltransferase small domain-containing protein n=1 Tax=Prymnesium parvum TaxID=97485 RepID=A0AB34JSC4_PRYPA